MIEAVASQGSGGLLGKRWPPKEAVASGHKLIDRTPPADFWEN
jgi:hypothetical protein